MRLGSVKVRCELLWRHGPKIYLAAVTVFYALRQNTVAWDNSFSVRRASVRCLQGEPCPALPGRSQTRLASPRFSGSLAAVTSGFQELASVDGTVTPTAEAMVPMKDDGLYRGDGAFEVIRLYDGKPFALVDHLDRLGRSAAAIELEFDRAALEAEIEALLGRGRRRSTASCG